jgi:hypothetical protein
LHLLADISSHGYGHLAQVAPVLGRLAERLPDLRLSVRSALPAAVLERRLHMPFRHIAESRDFGLVMHNAVDVDAAASASRYRHFHEDWPVRVDAEARQLEALAPDLVVSNVAYLPLAGAAAAGIPAVAMSSLNWADIVAGVLGTRDGMGRVHEQMLAAYRGARMFIRFTPGMPMSDLERVEPVGPVAMHGRSRRDEIDAMLGLERTERLVLVSFGGIEMRLPMEDWPEMPGVRWIVPAAWQARRADAVAFESLGMGFTDLIASCDVVLTKPGYGIFVEAACHGVPVLYVRRPVWPEEACLVDWLEANAVCAEVDRGRLATGRLAAELGALLERPRGAMPLATGMDQAAALLEDSLHDRGGFAAA